MLTVNLQIFILWAKRHNIEFDYSPYDAKSFEELESMELAPETIYDSNTEPIIFPKFQGEFSSLKHLKLAWFALDTIPAWVEGCKALEELNICGNNISLIPSWLENLSHLIKLDCSSNDLYTLPSSSLLLELDCSYNYLDGFGSWEGTLPRLQKLDCSRCKIQVLPQSIETLNALEEFIFDETHLLDETSQKIKARLDLKLQERKNLKNMDKKAWIEAFRVNTNKSYKKYLKAFPHGAYVDDAHVKLLERCKLKR